MECVCIDMDVNDFSDILSDTMPIARNEHKCIECARLIHPGEKYRKEKAVFEGCHSTYKTCVDCNSIRQEFVCGSWYWGEILEAVSNCIRDAGGNISESAIASLTQPARERICGLVEKYWD